MIVEKDDKRIPNETYMVKALWLKKKKKKKNQLNPIDVPNTGPHPAQLVPHVAEWNPMPSNSQVAWPSILITSFVNYTFPQ